LLALVKLLPEPLRTKALFHFGISVMPMMRYVRPRLVELTPDRTTVRIDVSRRSKNGYNSLFLGALAAGGDCAAGLFPMKFMFETGHRTIPIVKSVSSEYYKRITTYAHFTCTQGKELYGVCNAVVASGERQEFTVYVNVTAPSEFGDEVVAKITQVMSVKDLNRKSATKLAE
jgi:acyl-coenzyme A thioesterase PaaI-like protein